VDNKCRKDKERFETPSRSTFYATSPLSYSLGDGHYAVVKFDGSATGLYIDGVPVATQSASASPDSAGEEPIRMGPDSQSLSLMQAIAATKMDKLYHINGNKQMVQK
jgi:hypothetical protein